MRSLLFVILTTYTFSSYAEIELLYNERPPYLSYVNGTLSGLTATPTIEAFKKANIEFKLRKVPTKRQLHIIKENGSKACAIGWFKKPERELLAVSVP